MRGKNQSAALTDHVFFFSPEPLNRVSCIVYRVAGIVYRVSCIIGNYSSYVYHMITYRSLQGRMKGMISYLIVDDAKATEQSPYCYAHHPLLLLFPFLRLIPPLT